MLFGLVTTPVLASTTKSVIYSADFKFSNQVSIKKTFKPTRDLLFGSIYNMKSWGNNDESKFKIKLFKQNFGSVTYEGAYIFSKNGNHNFEYTVVPGSSYTAELWAHSGTGGYFEGKISFSN